VTTSPIEAAMTTSDEAVLQERFATLVTEHGAGLGRVARAYSRSSSEAADLAQDIALAIWRALPSFRGECGERAFIFRVAHNRGLSHADARRARDAVTLLEEPPAVVDERPAPDEALDAARRREALWDAIADLGVGHRAVLTLALEGLSHDEIGEVLGITAGNVAVRLSRAKSELRALLGGRS
jgi:RNA polymerase sigma factor (sigma-70 family)